MLFERDLTDRLLQKDAFGNESGIMYLAAVRVSDNLPRLEAVARVRHPCERKPLHSSKPKRDYFGCVLNSTIGSFLLRPATLDYVSGSANLLNTGCHEAQSVYAFGAEDPRVIHCGEETMVVFHQPDLRASSLNVVRRVQHIHILESAETYVVDSGIEQRTRDRYMDRVDKNYAPLCLNSNALYLVTSVKPLRILGPCIFRPDNVVWRSNSTVIRHVSCPLAKTEFPTPTEAFRDQQLLRGGTQYIEVIPGRAFVSLAHTRKLCLGKIYCHQAVVLVLMQTSKKDWQLVFYPFALRLYRSGVKMVSDETIALQDETRRDPLEDQCRSRSRRVSEANHSTLNDHLWVSLIQDPVSILYVEEKSGDAVISLTIDDAQVVFAKIPGLVDYVQRVAACTILGDPQNTPVPTANGFRCTNGALFSTDESQIRGFVSVNEDIVRQWRG